jgi:hypothetical protein
MTTDHEHIVITGSLPRSGRFIESGVIVGAAGGTPSASVLVLSKRFVTAGESVAQRANDAAIGEECRDKASH